MSENQTNEPLSTGEQPTNSNSEEVEPPFADVKRNETSKTKKKKKQKRKAAKLASKTVFYGPTGVPQSDPKASKVEPRTEEIYSSAESLTEIPQTVTETSEMPTPTVVLNLPAKPDEWFIQPATYDPDGNLLTEETFIFLCEGIEIIKMPLTENNFGGLSEFLSERFATKETNTTADYFHVRKPLVESEELDPVMTLTQNNRILATTTLDQKTLKQLIKALQKHVIKSTTITAWATRWWNKHKVWRVFLAIGATPLILIFIYSLFWGLTH